MSLLDAVDLHFLQCSAPTPTPSSQTQITLNASNYIKRDAILTNTFILIWSSQENVYLKKKAMKEHNTKKLILFMDLCTPLIIYEYWENTDICLKN